jgi:hypothetical protein
VGDAFAALRLARLRDALKGRAALSADDAEAIAAALDQYFDGAELAAALDLKPGSGQPDPRRLLVDRAVRDAIAESVGRSSRRFPAPQAVASQLGAIS